MAYPADSIAFNLDGFGGFGGPDASASRQTGLPGCEKTRGGPFPSSHMLSTGVAEAALTEGHNSVRDKRQVIWHGLSSAWSLG